MAKTISTKDWVYLCMTAHHWGSGKTESAAISRCRLEAGSDWVKKHGYVLYKVHPKFEIDCVNGSISTPVGHAPVKVRDAIKRKEQPATRKLQCTSCHHITETTGQYGKLSCGNCLMERLEVVELLPYPPA